VSWTGSPGPGANGIASYEIFVSDDGAAFTPFLTSTTQTSATFTGAFGHTYVFYSLATDNFGDHQTTPGAHARTTVAPLVTMTSVQSVTNKKHLVTEIIVTFSGGVNAGEADRTTTYCLVIAGKHGSFTAKNAKVIKLKSAVYNAATHTVTLTPAKAFSLAKPVQVLVHGVPPSGLQDSSGRFIDGKRDGQPGSDAVAVLSRGGTVINAVIGSAGDLRSAPRRGQETRAEQGVGRFRLLEPAAVDHLLEREEAIAVKYATRGERAFRDDAVTTTHQPRPRRDEQEPGPPMAQIRVDWKPPLSPGTEWAPGGDRIAGPFEPAPGSSGHFTFESSGLSSPGRRSDGSAERRMRHRSS
jgi:hypothetical protein